MKKIAISILPLLALALPFGSTAQAVSTQPVGAMKMTIPGDSTLSFLGLNFVESPSYVGTISSIGTNTLTAIDVDFDEALTDGESYYIEISEGTNAGLNTSISSWSGDTLTLSDDMTGLITVDSDQISIYRMMTIADIFGDENEILEGGSATTADLIYIPNPSGSGLLKIYYSTGGFTGTGWRIVGEGSTDASQTPIYYSDGILVNKKSSGSAELIIAGTVKITPTIVVIPNGFTPFNTIYPAGTTLETSGLYDSESPSTSITPGSATTADIIYTDSDGDGVYEKYYYSSGGFTGTGWRKVGAGATDMASTTFGNGFGLIRQSDALEVERPVPFPVE